MLPSMPILFTRESQDAFGNKIELDTGFFSQKSVLKTAIKPELPPECREERTKAVPNETEVTEQETLRKKDDPPKIDENALEKALVRSYYRKVQLRFATNSSVSTNKFIQFQELLKTFDPSKETSAELYRKVEKLFGDDHKDIVEEFLLFLNPGQAAEVGRFMDHFMLVQMTNFIDKLQFYDTLFRTLKEKILQDDEQKTLLITTFSRKPTVLRKILRTITTGLNSGSSEEMRARVLPHLRSSPRLTQMFKSLFPDERPPDSSYENGTDTLSERILMAGRGYDVWEFEDKNDSKRKVEVKESLDTMYLQGRVFLQHGRILRSASVTYPYSKEPYRVHARRLAPAHCHLSPPESDNDRSKSPKRSCKNVCKIPAKRPKKQHKSPTKTIKDVNDNTKQKECIVSAVMKQHVKGKNVTRNKTVKEKKDFEMKEGKKDKKEVKYQLSPKKEEVAKVILTKIDETPVNIETKSWTRDEDKTILQVLKCEANSEQILGRMREQLPHRTATEIKERFCHVLNFIAANGGG